MIKMIFCLHRLPGLSREDFQLYWRERHAPLVQEVAPILRIRRYVQSHSFTHAAIAGPVDARYAGDGFDGVAELYWDSIEDLKEVGGRKEERDAGRRLVADERVFIDLARSPIFWSRETRFV
jgi:uncharacterized protein (TIGR02118 family)